MASTSHSSVDPSCQKAAEAVFVPTQSAHGFTNQVKGICRSDVAVQLHLI